MKYHRCRCGKSETWESGMPPYPCQTCDKCGSTLSWSPKHHPEPEPHEPEDLWIIRQQKPVQIRRCRRCYKEIEVLTHARP